MKKIKLTQGKVTLVDDDMYEYLNQWKWHAHKARDTFYAARGQRVNGKLKTIYMHRLILGLTEKERFGDHVDLDGLNNQKYNLRPSTNAENLKNRRPRKGSSSRFLGVCWHKKSEKWLVRICIEKKNKHLGLFDDEKLAAAKYNEFAIKHHKQFARLNVV